MRFIQVKLPKKITRKLPNTARRRKALAYHQSWLEKRGLDTKSLKRRLKTWTGYPFPDLSTDPNYPKCSDKIPVGTSQKKEILIDVFGISGKKTIINENILLFYRYKNGLIKKKIIVK